MKTFLRRKDFSVSASIFPALVLTLGAPSTAFAPLFSFREQQAPSRIIEIKHLHEEDKLIKETIVNVIGNCNPRDLKLMKPLITDVVGHVLNKEEDDCAGPDVKIVMPTKNSEQEPLPLHARAIHRQRTRSAPGRQS